jgi:hypothetical protein
MKRIASLVRLSKRSLKGYFLIVPIGVVQFVVVGYRRKNGADLMVRFNLKGRNFVFGILIVLIGLLIQAFKRVARELYALCEIVLAWATGTAMTPRLRMTSQCGRV